MSHVELAIRGGTVVDGTGRDRFQADVGIADGRIVEIGEHVEGAEEIDGVGRVVTPGFIDVHTHYDAQALWDPELTPSSWHGVTSVVMGNCGFGLAPVRPEGREILLETLEQVEDMHPATLRAGIDWDFSTFGEYLEVIDRIRPAINVGGYVGHTPVRVFVMGDEAADRQASEEEIEEMAAVAARALREGALGFSTDRAGFIAGAGGRPVPSVLACQREVEALMGATAKEGRGIVHIAPGEDYQWLYGFQRRLGRTINWSSILAYREGTTTRTPYWRRVADHQEGRRSGADVWAQVTCRPIRQVITLREPAPLSSIPAFAEVFRFPPDARAGLYADPTWRTRAAEEIRASSVPLRWETVAVSESRAHPELVGRSVGSLDALCDIALSDELETRFEITFANDDPEAVGTLLRADGCILGLSDAGAHVSQICDAVLPTDFLAHWVRDRGVLSLEAGVRKLTGELAQVMGLRRGVLVEGAPADLVVLDLQALDPGPVRRVHDMPAKGERLVADAPGGVDAVVVNGVAIRRGGRSVVGELGRRPGAILRSAA